ncbi:MAG TPA: hypothetical protein VJB12_04070 [Candidatus Nanoarchaeia archaeon]|nr:hypothetical protein [Candidatus Nanoarchaeia archaeon]
MIPNDTPFHRLRDAATNGCPIQVNEVVAFIKGMADPIDQKSLVELLKNGEARCKMGEGNPNLGNYLAAIREFEPLYRTH